MPGGSWQSARKGPVPNTMPDLVVFPELSLTGYPPEDLLLRPSLSGGGSTGPLAEVAGAGIECPIAIGFPQAADEGFVQRLDRHRPGQATIATYHKQQLPNYQVFDEQRYFRPGGSPCLVELFGARVAFTICEDLWREHPVLQAGNAGATLLININASPYHVDKTEERKAVAGKTLQTRRPFRSSM